MVVPLTRPLHDIALGAPGVGAVRVAPRDAFENLRSTAGGVDFNGDGVGDVLFGSTAWDAGYAYALLGPLRGRTISVPPKLKQPVFSFDVGSGFAGDGGKVVAGIGDMNGDGFGEVAIGDGPVGWDGYHGRGSVWIVYGRPD